MYMYYGIAQHEYGPRTTHFWPSARGLGPMLGLRHLLAQAAAPMELRRALRPEIHLGSSRRGERLCN